MWTLVTGGAKRLGASLCLALAGKKYPVVIHYRHSKDEASEVAKQCRSLGSEAEIIQGDFSSQSGLEEFAKKYAKKFPETSGLINNVGNYVIGSALETSYADWISLFQTNLFAAVYLSQSLIPSLILTQGQIINIGTAGLTKKLASTYATAYMMTKDGLWSLTRSFAKELAPHGVRVNMVSPGELDISIDHHPLPMHRPASCEEVSRAVTFLLDSQSSYITGQNIEVAGGLSL